MGSGFQAWAQDGSNVVQIDGDAGVPNLQLISKVVVASTTVQNAGTLGQYYVSAVQNLPAGIVNPVLALRCMNEYAVVFWLSSTQYQIASATSKNVTVYIFGKASVSGGNHFQVFDASGNLVFDAGRAPMRVVAHYAPTALGVMGALPNTKTYAVVITAGSSRFVQSAGPSQTLAYVLRMAGQYNTGTGNMEAYGVAVEYTAPDGSAKTSWGWGQAFALVLDVTNL